MVRTGFVWLTIVVFGFLALASDANAQSSGAGRSKTKVKRVVRQESGVRLLPHVGGAFFEQVGSVDAGQPDSGLTLGVLADFGTGPLLFETGLQYLQAGARTAGLYQGRSASGRVRLDYIGVPLLAKFYVSGDVRSQGVYMKAGAMPMVLVGNQVSVVDGNSGKIPSELLEPMDVVAVVGLGSSMIFERGMAIFVDGTFNRGLVKVNALGERKILNQGFTLNLGAAFEI